MVYFIRYRFMKYRKNFETKESSTRKDLREGSAGRACAVWTGGENDGIWTKNKGWCRKARDAAWPYGTPSGSPTPATTLGCFFEVGELVAQRLAGGTPKKRKAVWVIESFPPPTRWRSGKLLSMIKWIEKMLIGTLMTDLFECIKKGCLQERTAFFLKN